MMNVPVLGIFVNYSYVLCPDCGKKIEIFGQSQVKETAEENGIKLLGQIPIDTSFTKLADEGRFEDADTSYVHGAVEVLVQSWLSCTAWEDFPEANRNFKKKQRHCQK